MLNQSLSRLRLNTLAISVRPSPTPAGPSATFTTRSHQRRNSSSKPPIPPHNGAPPIPTAVKQVGTPRTDKRPTAPKRSARKAMSDEVSPQDSSSEWVRSLPFVPSTQHLNPKDVYVASFFSTHRPISISGPLPAESTMADIDRIFSPAPKRKTNDVIYTLTSAINSLEQHEPEGNVKVMVEALARRFRPFNPPDAPVAQPDISKAEAEAEAEALDVKTQPSTSAANTAEDVSVAEVVDVRGAGEAVTGAGNAFFTPSFVPRRRRMGMPERRRMLLISVKRQRRLKMKKHKYKKLQRATRNLRRRQGKI